MRSLIAASVLVLTLGENCMSEEKQGNLSLTGTGIVKAKPDECYIHLGVVTEGKTSAEAMKANNEAMRKVFNGLGKFNITEENVKTKDFSVQQKYKIVKEGKEEKNVPDGFLVYNSIQVTNCHFEKTGEVLDTLVSAGANQVQSIQFGSSKAKEHLEEARKLAVRDAMSKAQTISKELGVSLGKPLSVNESGGGLRENTPYARSAMADGPGGTVPVSGGSLSFSINVNVIWELK